MMPMPSTEKKKEKVIRECI